jgi:hypothetical protein
MDGMVPSPDVWNRLCDLVEYSARMAFVPPLYDSDTPDGRIVRSAAPISLRPAKLTGTSLNGGGTTGIGFYSGILLGAPTGIDPSITVTQAMIGDDSSTTIVYFLNPAELGDTEHSLPIPCNVDVVPHGIAPDKTPVYRIIGIEPSEDVNCGGSGS